MKKINLLYLLLILLGTGLILFLFIYTPKNENKFIIADIKVGIQGKVKEKVTVRDKLLTHAIITRSNKVDTLIFLGESIDSLNINDNIVKPPNSPFIYILREGESGKKLKYVSIPKSILKDESFPKGWKDSCKNSWKSVVVDN